MSRYERPSHRVYMTFFLRKSWQVQIVEADLKTPLPKIIHLCKTGEGSRAAAARGSLGRFRESAMLGTPLR
jgi:hypothetical protein